MVDRHITLPDLLDQYVRDTQINLSWFVKAKLEDRIKEEGKTEKYIAKK